MTPPETETVDPKLAEREAIKDINQDYKQKFGFNDPETGYVYKAPKGLSRQLVEDISDYKDEPQWMREFRLKALEHFRARPVPQWGADLDQIDFEDIHYFVRASERAETDWDDVPEDIKKTFDRLGIPEAERNFLAGVGAQYESEVVYHQVRKDLEEQGVHFVDMDTGLREHEDIVREHFASLIPANDNMLAALNSAVWSGGSFVYVPPGVKVEMPLQAYFRINTENMGQFERTLIIADEGSDVHYIEGCHLAGSMVRVRDGEKPIEEIEAGDEVLTHRGRFRRVREPQRRRFVGPIRHIRFQGEGYRSLAVTPAHPFYAVKRKRRRDHNTEFAPQWLEAKDLEKGDYLGLPTGIDTGYERDPSWGEDVTIGRGRSSAVVERVDVDLSSATCRLIGLYLAQGSVSGNTSYLSFTTHRRETDLREAIATTIADQFGLDGWEYDYNDERAATTAVYSSVRAARFFAQAFGRTTEELRVPDWAFGLGEPERAALVRGFYEGEGSYDPKLDLHRINQVNQGVAQRMRELLLSLGIRASLSCTERGAPRRDIWQIAICKADHPRFEQLVVGHAPQPQRASHAGAVISDGYVWMPISSIDVIEANCEVFNMSVEEDESYVCEGVVSHNCTAPVYSTDSLHSAVVELIARPGARIRYTTVQNWSQNVYNLVTKRARAERDATVEWVDCNLGCLTGDSMIGTPDRGPVPIRDIEEGDLVFGTDLSEMKPVARRVSATRDNGVQPTFKITTENFRQLEATANHPFLVLDRPAHGRSYAMRWRRLENISAGDYVAVGKGTGDAGRPRFLGDYEYRAPSPRSRPRPLKLPLETSEDLMWLLGVFIGDGGVERAKGAPRRVNFAVPPEDHARPRLAETLKDVFDVEGVNKGPATLAVNSSMLGDFILWLGFGGNAHEKRIPGWVFALPAAQKLAFIEGYLDSDGHERNSKVVDGVQLGQITWASVNKDLLEDLKLLLIDCGLEPRKISTYRSTRKLPLGPEERTYTTHYLAMNLRGNLEAIRSHRAPRPVVEFVRVASIDELGQQQTYDIEVEGIHNFTANGIVVHNSKITMKYPSVYLTGERAHGEILSIAFAGNGQHQDAGGKIIHAAPKTTSSIFAKSISKDGGRSTYRGLLEVAKGASEARSKVVCDALLLDPESRSDTYPTIRIDESDANVGHEASVSKIGEEQLYYLQSHGLDEEEASKLIVNGFIEPVVKELPMEYAVELNRLIELQMEGSIG